MRKGPDVVVVGAGVVGLSIAFQLALRGASVTVLDRAGIGAGASGVQPGGIRQQWGTRVNCLLVHESMRFYADAQVQLHMRVDPGFRACGYLFLAHSDNALARMPRKRRAAERARHPVADRCPGRGGRTGAGPRRGRAWSAARGVQRTATSTGRSRWSRPFGGARRRADRRRARRRRLGRRSPRHRWRTACRCRCHRGRCRHAAAPARLADSAGGALSLLQRPDAPSGCSNRWSYRQNIASLRSSSATAVCSPVTSARSA